jgi:hypothetical protein
MVRWRTAAKVLSMGLVGRADLEYVLAMDFLRNQRALRSLRRNDRYPFIRSARSFGNPLSLAEYLVLQIQVLDTLF